MVIKTSDDDEFLLSICQQLAGNARLLPALRAPGMDTRAGEIYVMDIPWGVALRAPVQGPMKHHMRLAVWSLVCANSATVCSSASI